MTFVSKLFADLVGYIFRFVFGIAGNFAVTAVVLLFMLHATSFPVKVKKREKTLKTAVFNASWKRVKAETQEKYHGNQKLVNRMYYEYKKANKPAAVKTGIPFTVFDYLFSCGLYSVLFNPFSSIIGVADEKLIEVMNKLSATSQIDLIAKIKDSGIDIQSLFGAADAANVETYIKQMNLFGINLACKPVFGEFNELWILPIISIFLTVVMAVRTIMKTNKSNVAVLPFSILGAALSVLFAYMLPNAMTFYIILRKLVGLVVNAIVKTVVKKKGIERCEFKEIDLTQFDDLKEELEKEAAVEPCGSGC